MQCIEEKRQEYGITKSQLINTTGIKKSTLDKVYGGSYASLSTLELIKIGLLLELDIDELFIYYFSELKSEEMKELDQAVEAEFIVEYFDIEALTQFGFLAKKSSTQEKVERIRNFFGLQNIREYEEALGSALYSKTKKAYCNKMNDFFAKSAHVFFKEINNPNPYSRSELLKLIPKIKPYSCNVEQGLKTVIQALYHVGVTVIFQRHLPKTQTRGATLIVNDKPCIVLTDFRSNYATVWFALIHELSHVLFDMDLLKDISYHLTGEPDLFLIQEDKANKFAADYLVSEENMKFAQRLIDNPSVIEQLAEKWQVHPSIIYGQYQWREAQKGNLCWHRFHAFFPDLQRAIKGINLVSWEAESLEEEAQKIKSKLTV